MPLLTELFILFGLNYKDAAPTALNAAFFWIQERAGQKLKREIQSQRLNETVCKQRRLLTVRQREHHSNDVDIWFHCFRTRLDCLDRRGSYAACHCLSSESRLVFRVLVYSIRQLDFPAPECEAGMEAGGHSDRWIYCDRHWLLGRWITVFTMTLPNKPRQAAKLPSPISRPFRLRFRLHCVATRPAASARRARDVQ
jgi:hypothetical protein